MSERNQHDQLLIAELLDGPLTNDLPNLEKASSLMRSAGRRLEQLIKTQNEGSNAEIGKQMVDYGQAMQRHTAIHPDNYLQASQQMIDWGEALQEQSE